MKNVKLTLLAIAATLFITVACEKDDNGNRITYYKNKTGEGYVFYKFSNDSIAIAKGEKIRIESYTTGWFSTITRHEDYVYADNSGKYSFKFIKAINGDMDINYRIAYIAMDKIMLGNSKIISIDTIYYYPEVQPF